MFEKGGSHAHFLVPIFDFGVLVCISKCCNHFGLRQSGGGLRGVDNMQSECHFTVLEQDKRMKRVDWTCMEMLEDDINKLPGEMMMMGGLRFA